MSDIDLSKGITFKIEVERTGTWPMSWEWVVRGSEADLPNGRYTYLQSGSAPTEAVACSFAEAFARQYVKKSYSFTVK